MRQKWRRSAVPAQHRIQALLEEAFVLAHDSAAGAASDPRHDTYADVAVVLEALLRALEKDRAHTRLGKLPAEARILIKSHTTSAAEWSVSGSTETFASGPTVSISNRTDDLKLLVKSTFIFHGHVRLGAIAKTKAERAALKEKANEAVHDIGWLLQSSPHSFGQSKDRDYHKACASIERYLTVSLDRKGCSAKTLAIGALVAWGLTRRRATDLLRNAEGWTSG